MTAVSYFLSDLSFPPTEGLHQHSVAVIEGLGREGHQLKVAGWARPRQSIDYARMIAETGATVDAPLRNYRWPWLLQYAWVRFAPVPSNRAMRRRFASADGVVILDGLVASALLTSRRANVIVSLVDPGSRRHARLARLGSLSRGRRLAHGVAARFYRRIERRMLASAAVVHVVSPSDAEYLSEVESLDVRILSIPIPQPGKVEARLRDGVRAEEPRRSASVLIYADLRLGYMLASVRELAQALVLSPHRIDGIEFRVLGRTTSNPTLRDAFGNLQVRLLDFVEDFVEEIIEADVVVLPDPFGTGLKTRAIQGLLAGRPTVGLPAAFEGIPVVSGRDGFVCSSVQELADCVWSLVVDPTLANSVGAAGRRLADENFTSAAVLGAWSSAIDGVITHSGRSSQFVDLSSDPSAPR